MYNLNGEQDNEKDFINGTYYYNAPANRGQLDSECRP